MLKVLQSKKGQSILEYLIIATIVVGAILFAKPAVERNMRALYTNAGNKTEQANQALGRLTLEQ